jgi:hypothetical protein
MKVFMSWSGARSKAAAELLHYWIKCVVQASQPWISTRGIDRGSLWFTEINNELKDTTFGIICLTQENKNAPWILFEAGALAKGLANSRVCTFLVDLETKDIRDPLAQFNHTLPDKAGLWNLVLTLNSSLETNRLEPNILEGVFETYWPQFQEKFNKIKEEIPETTVVAPRDDKDILAEILESTRNLSQRMRVLEGSTASASIPGDWVYAWTKTEKLGRLSKSDRMQFAQLASKELQAGRTIEDVEKLLLSSGELTAEDLQEILRSARNLYHIQVQLKKSRSSSEPQGE